MITHILNDGTADSVSGKKVSAAEFGVLYAIINRLKGHDNEIRTDQTSE